MSSKEWGNITWMFFHTLAHQIKENKFFEIKNKVINIIFNTCNHLPCPICSEDSKNILKKSFRNNIKTKQHFIEFLRQFHNIVNIKLEKKTFSQDEIKDIYNNKNIIKILDRLVYLYKKPIANNRMMGHSFQKQFYITGLLKDVNSILYALEKI